jgi:alpha-galactosidase
MDQELLSEFLFGDMKVLYFLDEDRHAGFQCVPAGMEKDIVKKCALEPLVELYFTGDQPSDGFTAGHTMRGSSTVRDFKYRKQSVQEGAGFTDVVTELEDSKQRRIVHTLRYSHGTQAFAVSAKVMNASSEDVQIEMISSLNLGGLSPFDRSSTEEELILHRMRSFWSAEGRVLSQDVDDLGLEPSWACYGTRIEKFGQIGSMPVRSWFPFAAVEDRKAGVTFAFQLACPSSWQFEITRRDQGLSVTCGLGDYVFAHWRKRLAPDDSFETPPAYFTVGKGGLDEVSQRLLTIPQQEYEQRHPQESLPVVFNEFCTSWGKPTESSVEKIAYKLQGHDIDYFVIDAGWYAGETGWSDNGGDWVVGKKIFPSGMQKTVQTIRDAGMVPGIWFELEDCAPQSELYQHGTFLLKRDGMTLGGSRRFLDMQNPEAREYLRTKVIRFLKETGFRYLKIDYNDTIGVGCDGEESLGENLRKNMMASEDFFQEIRRSVPGIVMENCSSGGHRLEPSLMRLFDMASFSDAHECKEIPIIAANLHRLVLPAQLQIWAVLRKTDTLDRIVYSMTAAMLGVLCLSGDVLDLSEAQWKAVDEGIAFYRSAAPIIRSGTTKFYGTRMKKYRAPEGWQAIVRTQRGGKRTLVIVHSFAGELPETLSIPVPEYSKLKKIYSAGGIQAFVADSKLNLSHLRNFNGAAFLLENE